VITAALALVGLLAAVPAFAADGAELYAEACASCHGRDGRGAPAGTAIAVPLPDFTDCAVTTSEATANWAGLVEHGGPFLGMSSQMPGFGAALSSDDVAAVLAYVRGFCRDAAYPLGDLNFPRAVFVEKAFPEDEAVLELEHEVARHERASSIALAIEQRIGTRGQVEVAAPVAVVDPDGPERTAGVGDVTVAYRHVLLAAPRWRQIVSAGAELVLPTGNRRHGVGAGTVVAAPQLFSGTALGPIVAQAQVRAELPADADRAPRQMLYRLALQLPLGPYKKDLVPALELEQSQALASDVHAATVLGPTLYVPLSRRGHIAVGLGALFPVAGTREFDWSLGGFVLWEYRDGPLWAW
jgi:cytochrome c6